MFIIDEHKQRCDDFLSTIASFEKAYSHIAFNYIALRDRDRFVILAGRVFLNTSEPAIKFPKFESANLKAGRYLLSELGVDLKSFLKQLLEGKIPTPVGTLFFDAGPSGHGASFTPLHDEGLNTQTRFIVLTIFGNSAPTIKQPMLDWEIKATTPPFDGIQEISTELGLNGMSGQTASIELVAFNVARVDARSTVTGPKATVGITLAKDLDKSRAALGYRVFTHGKVQDRAVLKGDELTWTEENTNFLGQKIIDVPPAAVINAVASYDGLAQHTYWIGDPEKTQNSRRTVYETFDPKLEGLRATIESASQRGQDARQLEHAVSWILWLLGFNVMHLGGTPRTRDAADILATTPSGHFAIVECTTGLLKAENKLAVLHARATTVRQSLADSNSGHLRVLPVIVTTRAMAQVQADIEAAERLGILVFTKENLEAAIERTLIERSPDEAYREAEQRVIAAREKYQSAHPIGPSPSAATARRN